MGTTVAAWRVTDGAVAPARLATGSLALEKHLEQWIEADPELLEEGLVVVARQLMLDGGPLDLLCLDAQGGLVVVELKRDQMYRSTLAQAIDYAASIATMPTEDLDKRLRGYLTAHPSPTASARLAEQASLELPDAGRREVAIVLAGIGRDPGLDRSAEFLGEGYGVPIRVVSFQVMQLGVGEQLLVREVTETSDSASPRGASGFTWESVLGNAELVGVGDQMRAARALGEGLGLYPRPWKVGMTLAPLGDRRRYAFSFWPRPDGGEHLLGMLYSPSILAQHIGIPEAASAAALGEREQRLTLAEFDRLLDRIERLFADHRVSSPEDGAHQDGMPNPQLVDASPSALSDA